MKKGAGKKAGQLIVEATMAWQAQEEQWRKEEIVLQHTLRTARSYLAAIQDEANAVADAIEREVEKRKTQGAESEQKQRAFRTESRELQDDLARADQHGRLQQNTIHSLRRDKDSMGSRLASRRVELAGVRKSATEMTVAEIEARLAALRQRIVELRRGEASVQATVESIAAPAATVTAERLLTASGSCIVLGRPALGPAGILLRRLFARHADRMSGGFVHVLGSPSSALDMDGNQLQHTNHSGGGSLEEGSHDANLAQLQRACHRARVTRLLHGEAAARHVGATLRTVLSRVASRASSAASSSASATRLLVLSGQLLPGRTGVLDLRCAGEQGSGTESPVTVALRDVFELACSAQVAVVVDALAPLSERGAHGFSVAWLPGTAAPVVLRHRQEVAAAMAATPASWDGLLASTLALLADTVHSACTQAAEDCGDGHLRAEGSHVASPLSLPVLPSTLREALIVATTRSTASRAFEPVEDASEWPWWVPAKLLIAATPPATSADAPSTADDSTSAAKPEPAEPAATTPRAQEAVKLPDADVDAKDSDQAEAAAASEPPSNEAAESSHSNDEKPTAAAAQPTNPAESGDDAAKPPPPEGQQRIAALLELPLVDRALLSSCGVATGATLAFHLRRRLKELSHGRRTSIAMRVAIRVNKLDEPVEESLARFRGWVPSQILRRYNEPPLRWLWGHCDDAVLTKNLTLDFDEPAVAASEHDYVVVVERVPAGASADDLLNALCRELRSRSSGAKPPSPVALSTSPSSAVGFEQPSKQRSIEDCVRLSRRFAATRDDHQGPCVLNVHGTRELIAQVSKALDRLVDDGVKVENFVSVRMRAETFYGGIQALLRELGTPLSIMNASAFVDEVDPASVSVGTDTIDNLRFHDETQPYKPSPTTRSAEMCDVVISGPPDALVAQAGRIPKALRLAAASLSARQLASLRVTLVHDSGSSNRLADDAPQHHEQSSSSTGAPSPSRHTVVKGLNDGGGAAASRRSRPTLTVFVGGHVAEAQQWTTSVADLEGFHAQVIADRLIRAVTAMPLVTAA